MKNPRKTRLAVGIAALVAFCVAFAFLVRGMAAKNLTIPALEAQFTKSTGLSLRTQGVHLHWNGNIMLDGVSVGTQEAAFLSAREAQIKISLLPLLVKKTKISSVDLTNPTITLNPRMIASLSELLKKRPSPQQTFPVTFSQGLLHYTTPAGEQVSLQDIKGNFSVASGKSSLAIRFKDKAGGLYDVNGDVSSRDLNLKGKIKNIDLQEAFAPLGMNPIPELQGETSGDFALSGPYGDLQFTSNFSVSSGLFKCTGTLTASLPSGGPPKRYLTGKLVANSGEIQGIGQFKSFSIDFLEPKQSFVFQNGTLEFSDEKIFVSGKIAKNHAVTVRFNSPSFNPFSLPNFSGWGVNAKPGAFEGTAAGTFPNLVLSSKGVFPQMSAGGKTWNHCSVDLQAVVSSRSAQLKKLLLVADGIPLSLSGNASWDNAHNLHFYFAGVDASSLAKLFGLTGKLSPLRIALSGTVDYDKSKRQWTGVLHSAPGIVAGIPFQQFSGGFSYQEKQPVQVTGSFESEGRKAVVDGQWKNGKGTFNLNASGFPLTRLPFLGNSWQGFRGVADIRAHYSTVPGSENQIDFSIPHPSYQGAALPQLAGTVYVRGNSVRFSPLKILGVGPELDVTGTYDLESKQESITAKLNGQNLEALFPLAHAKLPPFRGLPFGTLEISGVYPRIFVKFSGTVKNLRFENFAFEEGKLTLSGPFPDQLLIHFQTDQFSLGNIPFLQKFMPGLSGAGTLSASRAAAGGAMIITFQVPEARWKEKSLGTASGSVVYEGSHVTVKELTLPVSNPPLSLAGAMEMNGGNVDLRAALNGQRIGDLAALMGGSTAQADGRLYGSANLHGPVDNLKFNFSGDGKELKFAGNDIGDAHLSLYASKQSGGFAATVVASGISVSQVAMFQKNFPGISGDLTMKASLAGGSASDIHFALKNGLWEGKKFPDISGAVLMENQIAKFKSLDIEGLVPPVHAQGTVNSDTHSFNFSANLGGQRVSSLLQLIGQTISGFDARFSGPISLSGTSAGTQVQFSGAASDISFHALQLGSGHVNLNARSDPNKHFSVHVTATQIPVENIAAVASRFPGISGNLNLAVLYNTATPEQASIDFSVTNASRGGVAFPKLNGHADWKAPVLQLDPLVASGMNPSLSLSGSVDSGQNTTQISGKLEGQTIQELMALTGTATADVNGKLFGPLEISGPSSELRVQFSGQVTNLTYRGVQLGEGQLSIAVTKTTVNGRLELDKPVSFDPKNSLLGSVLQNVPGIGGFLGQVTSHLVITGVTIQGSPQHPAVTPTLVRVAGPSTSQKPGQPSSPLPTLNPVNILQQIFKL